MKTYTNKVTSSEPFSIYTKEQSAKWICGWWHISKSCCIISNAEYFEGKKDNVEKILFLFLHCNEIKKGLNVVVRIKGT